MSSHPPHTIRLKTGETCVIREAEPRDAKGILDATFATLRAPDAEHSVSTPEEFSLSVDDEVAWVRKHQEQPGWIALVPEVDGTIVGLINFKNGPRTRIAHQGALGMNVHPDWRGRGIGDALLAELLAWARPVAVNEVEDPRGRADVAGGAVEDLREEVRRERRDLLEGLSTTVHPARSAGDDLQRHLVHGPVPRRDQRADAHGLVEDAIARRAGPPARARIRIPRRAARKASRWTIPRGICCFRATSTGAPISSLIASAIASLSSR